MIEASLPKVLDTVLCLRIIRFTIKRNNNKDKRFRVIFRISKNYMIIKRRKINQDNVNKGGQYNCEKKIKVK